MSIIITNPIFHNEDAAQAHCEASRWNGEPVCPHCGSVRIARLSRKTQTVYFLCNDCRDQFTVRTGSVMERSHVPLHKWLLAFHLMAASKKGVSAKQMERMLGVTYKTAWFLCHRVREAMNIEPEGPMGGPDRIVEVDETYVGGKAANKHRNKRQPGRGPANMQPVVTVLDREGRAKSYHVANVKASTLGPLLFTTVDRASILMTDESPIYRPIGREFQTHALVNHGCGEYVRGPHHTNSVENFFSLLKRGIVGTFHHVSPQHLHRYCAEFDLRYNTREMNDGERAAEIFKGSIGKRLTYRRIERLAA